MIIPDPFTNQLSSRFAGAIGNNNKKNEQQQQLLQQQQQQQQQSSELVHRKVNQVIEPKHQQQQQQLHQQQQQVPITVAHQTHHQQLQPSFTLMNGPKLSSSIAQQQSFAEPKAKPKATVKPSPSVVANDNESQHPKLIKVNVVNSSKPLNTTIGRKIERIMRVVFFYINLDLLKCVEQLNL